MLLKTKKRGFTLMEILVAISVFAVVIVTSTSVYINITREHKRSNLHNAMYEDSRLLIDKIASLGKQYTIDYEEYYSQLVVQKDSSDKVYGKYYGVYGSKFYDPGLSIKGNNPVQGVYWQDLGAECSNNGSPTVNEQGQDVDCVIYIPSLDNNTGQNPYDNNNTDLDSAVCESCSTPLAQNSLQKELYLISNDGTRKVIFALEKVNDTNETALAMVELIGQDTDGNGVVDEYTCDTQKGYSCPNNGGLPSSKDLITATDSSTGNKTDFVPISSLSTQIAKLQVLVSPLEDPRKAFTEKGKHIQMQPHFTIMITVEPTAQAKEKINFGDAPVVTVQTSITPRVYNEVKSYSPLKNIEKYKNDVLNTLP